MSIVVPCNDEFMPITQSESPGVEMLLKISKTDFTVGLLAKDVSLDDWGVEWYCAISSRVITTLSLYEE